MNTAPHSNNQSLVVWRDSVAAGDDIDAPHEFKLSVEASASVAHVVAKVISASYLPKISGGKATWIVEAGSQPIAVLAQQWSEPRYLIHSAQPLAALFGSSGRCHVYFKYWCQADPDAILECLKNDNPLPSRYS